MEKLYEVEKSIVNEEAMYDPSDKNILEKKLEDLTEKLKEY
jgi:hypothetical protein